MMLQVRSLELDWIQVELSSRCTGRCVYCPVHRFRDRRYEGVMTDKTFGALEPSLSVARLVFLQGWGEPLMDPHFWSRVERVREAGPKVGFTTSGTLLESAQRRALLESGVEIVGVSVAGARAGTHDRFRAGSPMATLDRNLRKLRREKEARGAEIPRVHVAYQVMVSNLRELPAVIARAETWGADEVVASHLDLILSPDLEKESLAFRTDLDEEYRARIDEARRLAQERDIAFHAYIPDRTGPRPVCTENVLKSCFVAVDGSVSPCVMANLGLTEGASATERFRGEDVPLTSLVFGNVNDRSLERIWRSRVARDFRKVFRSRDWQGARGVRGAPPPCKTCYKLFEG